MCPPGGGANSSRLAAHQWATSSSGNLRMRVWVAQWLAQWQAPLMMQRLLSKEWICFHQRAGMGHGQGARGAGKGVEWSGVGERERRAREARPPGKATHELVQLRHSSVLLLQFARFPSQMLPSHYSLVPSLPDCQSVESSHQCRLQPPPPAPSSELPLRGLHCYVPRKMAVAP